MIKLLIVGGSQKSTQLLKQLNTSEIVKIQGIADSQEESPGVLLARHLGIPVFTDFNDILSEDIIDVVVITDDNLELMEEIILCKSPKIDILSVKNLDLLLSGELKPNVQTNNQIHVNISTHPVDTDIEEDTSEGLNEPISRFLTRLSHEMRLPTNSISGFSTLLLDTDLDQLQKIYANSIEKNARILQEQIENILDISKITTDKFDLQCIDFNLDHLLDEIIENTKTKLGNKKINVYYRFKDSVPTSFRGDPWRVKQIIFTLVDNAIKFTQKGEIGIFIELGDEDGNEGLIGKDRSIKISIKDTGIGIPPEKLASILSGLNHFDLTLKLPSPEIGLGLTIVLYLVRIMGGKLDVSSQEDHGTQFSFSMRLEEVIPAALTDIQPLGWDQLKGKNILIVDERNETQDLLIRHCSAAQMNVMNVTSTVQEALGWLNDQSELPDLVISEIFLDPMSGYELATAIKSNSNLSSLKIVAITAHPEPGIANKAHEKGFDAFLAYPVSAENLYLVLQTTLGDQRFSGQIITQYMAKELMLKGLRVLVAEANIINQKLLQDVLKSSGVDIFFVSDGLDIIRELRSNDYDIILLDVDMPQMDSYEVARYIRHELEIEIPVVAITRTVQKNEKKKYLTSGITDYIIRPIDPKLLKDKLAMWRKH